MSNDKIQVSFVLHVICLPASAIGGHVWRVSCLVSRVSSAFYLPFVFRHSPHKFSPLDKLADDVLYC